MFASLFEGEFLWEEKYRQMAFAPKISESPAFSAQPGAKESSPGDVHCVEGHKWKD